MSLSKPLAIMPKAPKGVSSARVASTKPYPTSVAEAHPPGMWSSNEDEALLQARAAGLAWQPIRDRYFPSKTPNACRKRHERLIEKRRGEDWDQDKLDRLAQAYIALRKQIWEPLAESLDMRWDRVEAKCMEKGVKNLQTIARTAQRKASSVASRGSSYDDQGIADHTSDSGIGMYSDAEMEAGVEGGAPPPLEHQRYRIPAPHVVAREHHSRSRSLPQANAPLPLYQPPPPPIPRRYDTTNMTNSPITMPFPHPAMTSTMFPSESHGGRSGISIQQMLAPAEPHHRARSPMLS